jgi:hypothetical protein
LDAISNSTILAKFLIFVDMVDMEDEGMFHKKVQKEIYDKEKLKPVIRSSICTGEKVAGFKDLQTGKFTEVKNYLRKTP